MQKETIASFRDYHSYIQRLGYRTAIFRGVRKYSYQVRPSIGRQQFRNTLERDERRMFKLFKESSLPFLKFIPRNDFEWLAVAQHYGLPTRLLDWTYNPIVALYFAVEKDCDTDSAVYTFNSEEIVDPEKEKDPFSIDDVVRYRPPYISERITNQSGVFTLHNKPANAYEPDNMVKIKIPNDQRRRFKQILYKYGINRKTLFPGLEGIASDITWICTISH